MIPTKFYLDKHQKVKMCELCTKGEVSYYLRLPIVAIENEMLSCRRGIARRAMSVEILIVNCCSTARKSHRPIIDFTGR